jgi:hypothetical protein
MADAPRNGMRQHLWIAQLVRDIGFPSVVALLLLVKAPTAVREAVAADTAVRKEAMIAALNTQARAFEGVASQLHEMTVEARTIRMQAGTIQGLIMGKYKCPPRQCLGDTRSKKAVKKATAVKMKTHPLPLRGLLSDAEVKIIADRERALDVEMEKELARPIPSAAAAAVHKPYENGLPWESPPVAVVQ